MVVYDTILSFILCEKYELPKLKDINQAFKKNEFSYWSELHNIQCILIIKVLVFYIFFILDIDNCIIGIPFLTFIMYPLNTQCKTKKGNSHILAVHLFYHFFFLYCSVGPHLKPKFYQHYNSYVEEVEVYLW